MKTPSSRRKDGFTLVELLVVIAIIAVLAGAGFAAGNNAVQKARRMTALATCTSIESAVNGFVGEYGSMPKDNMTADTQVNTEDTNLLRVLLGSETTTPILNTRAIKFLTVKDGKAKGTKGTGGLVYDPAGTQVKGLWDPWGGAYYMMLDGDYNEEIEVMPAGAAMKKTLHGKRVAVWSNGADNITGVGGKTTDDVISWNP